MARLSRKAKPKPTNASGGLLDFYNNGISLPKLKEGKYTGRIIKHEPQKPKSIDGQPFIRFEIQLPDRVIVDNRFATGFQILLEQLKTQLNVEDQEIAVQDFLNSLLNKDLDIWISYAEVEGKGTYRNINYIPPQILATFDEGIENDDTSDIVDEEM